VAIKEVWSANQGTNSLRNIGRGRGIIFSPDLSEPGNRAFYSALGFAYFEGPDWRAVLDQLKAHNHSHPANPVEILLVQSHGTNGDALKLQTGNQPETLLATAAGAPDVPLWNYAGNKQWLQKNPELAKKWLAATAKATDWAMANPEAAVKAYEAYHKLKDSGYAVDLGEWKATIPLLKGSSGFFTATDAQWSQLGQALKDAGQLDQVLQPSEYYTNQYVGQ